MGTFNTTRGVPFDPGAAQQQRQLEKLARAQALSEEERAAKKQRAEELRAHGRALDEEAAARRRRQRVEVEAAYAERYSGDSTEVRPRFRSGGKKRR